MNYVDRPIDICIVTSEILGLTSTDEASRAYYSLGVLLAKAGHAVTILYAPTKAFNVRKFADCQRHLSQTGMALVQLPSEPGMAIRGSAAAQLSYGAYRWLKPRRFDLVHFQERGGLAFYSLLGKHQGLCLKDAKTCIDVHHPTLWSMEFNGPASGGADALECDFMERESVARADSIWTGSRSLLEWMEAHQWKIPPRGGFRTRPPIMPEIPTIENRTKRIERIRELVFVGKLDKAHGEVPICRATALTSLDRLTSISVSFWGQPAAIDGVDSEEYIRRRFSKIRNCRCKINSNADYLAALRYLMRPGRLAVLPYRVESASFAAVDCLSAGIPFIAAKNADVTQLVRSIDRERAFVDPQSEKLAEYLDRAFDSSWKPAESALDFDKNRAAWLDYARSLRSINSKRNGIRTVKRVPLVSVCLIHHERPHFLEQALASLRAQTYPKIEVVLVDDGSRTAEANRLLRSLEPEFQERRWKLIRQSNRYLGAARNTAARSAAGKYLLFMDDDNVAKPEEVEVFVRAMQTSRADILTCFLDVFRGDSYPSGADQTIHRLTFLGGAPTIGMIRNCFGDANCMIRREVFESLGGFSEDASVCGEDWELFANGVLSGYRLEVVPEALIWYRQSVNGMLHTTPANSNRMRALRPYFTCLSPDLHILSPMMNRLEKESQGSEAGTSGISRDQVRRIVIFGCGPGGALGMSLAQRCGWQVVRFVDNNREAWGSRIAGIPVKSPASLRAHDFDLVIVSSRSGKEQICNQLRSMGFRKGEDFAYYLDPVVIGNVEIRLRES